MTSPSFAQVDHAEIKTGQILTIAMAGAALFLQDPRLLMVLGVIFLFSGTVRQLSPFSWLYRGVVLPLGLLRSDYRLDNIQPHKFGQLVGAFTVLLALGLFYLGYPFATWAVVAALILLTLVSFLGWCIGCFLYYQLNRLGIRGFFRHKPVDSKIFPGRRPPRQSNGKDI